MIALLRTGRLVLPFTLLTASCTPEHRASDASLPLPVEVRADTSQMRVLAVSTPPEAHVWVSRVAPARTTPISVDLPDAPLDTLVPAPPPPPLLEIDDDLKPPILRSGSVLRVPVEYTRGRAVVSVELDVRVDETGEVTDALWTDGSTDSMLVQVATECALSMKFYPALQVGRPVPVWCRQRFDFGGGRAEMR